MEENLQEDLKQEDLCGGLPYPPIPDGMSGEWVCDNGKPVFVPAT